VRAILTIAAASMLVILNGGWAKSEAESAVTLYKGPNGYSMDPTAGNPYGRLVAFPKIQNWNSLKISLTRGICFGTCPIYSVAILGNGSVIFSGEECVAVKGTVHSRIPQSAVAKLVEEFRESKFFSLKQGYRASVTDLPTFRVEIAFDNFDKAVYDYGGEAAGMPAAVSKLEDAIDRTALSDQWV